MKLKTEKAATQNYSDKTTIEDLQKENQEMREALKSLAKNTSEYLSNIEPEGCCNGYMCGCLGKPTNPEYYIKEQADEYISKFNLSETPNSSKEGV